MQPPVDVRNVATERVVFSLSQRGWGLGKVVSLFFCGVIDVLPLVLKTKLA